MQKLEKEQKWTRTRAWVDTPRGRRNNSGQQLIEFCEAQSLSNSSFQHPAKHMTTWQQQRKDKQTNTMKTIYNQIDFIIVSQKHRHALNDSRSYSVSATELFSDHRIVVTRMRSEFFLYISLYSLQQ